MNLKIKSCVLCPSIICSLVISSPASENENADSTTSTADCAQPSLTETEINFGEEELDRFEPMEEAGPANHILELSSVEVAVDGPPTTSGEPIAADIRKLEEIIDYKAPDSTQTPGSATTIQQKESVFVRLSNRIKVIIFYYFFLFHL